MSTKLTEKMTSFNTLTVDRLSFRDGSYLTGASNTSNNITGIGVVRNAPTGTVLATVNNKFLVANDYTNITGTGAFITDNNKTASSAQWRRAAFAGNYLSKNPNVTISKTYLTTRSSAVLLSDGTLWVTGAAAYFLFKTVSHIYRQVVFPSNTVVTDFSISCNGTDIAATSESYIALDSQKRVFTWGSNTTGECGQGTIGAVNAPAIVADLSNKNVAQVFTVCALYGTQRHAICAVRTGTGQVWVAGSNVKNVLSQADANNNTLPSSETTLNIFQPVVTAGGNPLPDVAEIVSVNDISNLFFITNSFTLHGTGINPDGRLGDGTTTDTAFVKTITTNIKKAAIVGGYNNTSVLAIKTDDTLRVWGSNQTGQLGLGAGQANSITTPQSPIDNNTNLGFANITKVFGTTNPYTTNLIAGFIQSDGTLWLAGYNNSIISLIPVGYAAAGNIVNFSEVPHYNNNFIDAFVSSTDNPSDIFVLDNRGKLHWTNTYSSNLNEVNY